FSTRELVQRRRKPVSPPRWLRSGSLLTTPGPPLIGRAARGKHQVSSEAKPPGAQAPGTKSGRPDAGEVGGEEGPRGPGLEGSCARPRGAASCGADSGQGRQQGRPAFEEREPPDRTARRRSPVRPRLTAPDFALLPGVESRARASAASALASLRSAACRLASVVRTSALNAGR